MIKVVACDPALSSIAIAKRGQPGNPQNQGKPHRTDSFFSTRFEGIDVFEIYSYQIYRRGPSQWTCLKGQFPNGGCIQFYPHVA